MIARLWFCKGVEVFPGRVESYPPRPEIRIALLYSPPPVWDEPRSSDCDVVHTVTFRLAEWGPEIAHYDLDGYPPWGYAWFAFNGKMFIEPSRGPNVP